MLKEDNCFHYWDKPFEERYYEIDCVMRVCHICGVKQVIWSRTGRFEGNYINIQKPNRYLAIQSG